MALLMTTRPSTGLSLTVSRCRLAESVRVNEGIWVGGTVEANEPEAKTERVVLKSGCMATVAGISGSYAV